MPDNSNHVARWSELSAHANKMNTAGYTKEACRIALAAAEWREHYLPAGCTTELKATDYTPSGYLAGFHRTIVDMLDAILAGNGRK